MPYAGAHGRRGSRIFSVGAILLLISAVLELRLFLGYGLDLNAFIALFVVAAIVALAGLVTMTVGLHLRRPGEKIFGIWPDMNSRHKGIALAVLGVLPLLVGMYFLWFACSASGLIASSTAGASATALVCEPSVSLVGIALAALGADLIVLGFLIVRWDRTGFARIRFAKAR